MSVIKTDYTKALASARQLENAAEKCRNALNKAKQNYVARMEECWQGASGTRAREKLLNWCRELNGLELELTQTAQMIRMTVKRLQEADRRAAAAAAALSAASKKLANQGGGEGSSGAGGGGTRF